jgi:hypothetical protein
MRRFQTISEFSHDLDPKPTFMSASAGESRVSEEAAITVVLWRRFRADDRVRWMDREHDDFPSGFGKAKEVSRSDPFRFAPSVDYRIDAPRTIASSAQAA